jgi:hypothetical protein
MTKKRTPTVSLPLVVNPNAKQRAALKKAYANIRKEFARPEKRALIRELAGCFARAAVKRVIQEEKKKPSLRLKAKAGSRSPPIYFIPASAIEVRSKRRAKK